MIEAGHFAACLALVLSIFQIGFGLGGARHAAGRFAIAAFVLQSFAFATLISAFAASDFSLALAAAHSNTLKPLIYKIAGTWGNHEGSMALWCLVVLGFGAAGALFLNSGRAVFEARTLGIQGLIASGSLAYLLFASSPFKRLSAPPLQGSGLNPLLQDPALAIHPPMLYLGYVGFSFVFALAAAGMLEGRIDRTWARQARPWALAAWVPLTAGIALGSYWAYYELGWGGWWFWDPVENASFMPWLLGAALIHSLIVTEKRGAFVAWTALLAVLTFCFSILGAFLVRSGVLTSVHAFAVDPLRGSLLLAGLLAFGGGALALFAWRAPALRGQDAWALLSREGALMLNNLVLVVAAMTVLLGTLFPLIAEAAGEQISVGEPYFNLTVTPMLAGLLLTLPIVQAWPWGKAEVGRIGHWGLGFAVIFLVAWIGARLTNDLPFGAIIGIALGVWLIIGAGVELQRRATVWSRLFRLPLRVWGMSAAHAGLGVFILGAVIETSSGFERTLALPLNGSETIAGWTLNLESVDAVEGPNWYADRATLTARRDGRTFVLRPEKRYYPAARMPTTETAIHKTGTGDLYAALGDQRLTEAGEVWTFRVYFNPLIDLVFLGVTFMTLGGLLAGFGGRRRQRKAQA